ncbi:hypothetical protein A0H81_05863 [Grifola frondosa]|uniref:4'-phosphopantetheinyl transferase domain-containing protein n=1 Tax=Grifola frondosa TaxID=5627 RepID=A0A1C7MAK1_GRIFR|nr:hypothetical protein A0H81_05863 [Grifola frondosa]
MDCPLLVWMLYLNREMTVEEYEICYKTMTECVPHARVRHAPESPETTRQIIAYLLPLLMMRHRRVPRSRWKDYMGPSGKHWIEQEVEPTVNPAYRLRSIIGYHLAYDRNVIGMVMTQGRQRDVLHLGIGVKVLDVNPAGTNPLVYAESFHHRLTPLELTFIAPELGEEVVLRRLCLILALKQAYIKAIGQPLGFDWSRLEFNIPERTAMGDQIPLQGWEFRLWQTNIGILRNGEVVQETYQCALAFFRGSLESHFVWETDPKALEKGCSSFRWTN